MAQQYVTREELDRALEAYKEAFVNVLSNNLLRVLSVVEKQEAGIEALRDELRALRTEISEKLGAVEAQIEEAKDEGVAQIKQEIQLAKDDVLTAFQRPSPNY